MEPLIRDLDYDSSRGHFSTPWLQKLLGSVNYNFSKGKVFFCVKCKDGMYQKKEFQDGADHDGHMHFPTYDVNSSVSVHTAVMMSLNVDVSDVQSISHWGHYYNFLHNIHTYFQEPAGPTDQKCLHCKARILGSFVNGKIKYCCLECKYLSSSYGHIKSSEQNSQSLPHSDSQDQTPSQGPVLQAKKTLQAQDLQLPQNNASDRSANGSLLVRTEGKRVPLAECTQFVNHESHMLDSSTAAGKC